MSSRFGNGLTFRQDARGRKVDREGFMTSSVTKIANIGWTCVSAKITRDGVKVRNTNDKKKVALDFTPAEWNAFVEGVKKGDFDIPS